MFFVRWCISWVEEVLCTAAPSTPTPPPHLPHPHTYPTHPNIRPCFSVTFDS